MLPAPDLVPQHLYPEVLVSLSERSLQLSDDDSRPYLRSMMTPVQLNAQIDAISALASAREQFGQFCLLGLKGANSGYACVDSASTLLVWMHDHEKRRLNQLKMALPTQAEEAGAARARIEARIALRKQGSNRLRA